MNFSKSQLTNLRNLDLFNCDVTSADEYRENTFKLLPQLKFLDGFDQNEQEEDEFEEGGSEDDEEDDDDSADEDGVEGAEGEEGDSEDDDDDDDDDDEDEDDLDEEGVDEEDQEVVLATKKMQNGAKQTNGAVAAAAATAKSDVKASKPAVRENFIFRAVTPKNVLI